MKIQITETVLRDAQQSLMATRMPTADFLPILEKMDQAGYYSLECWGGATFDSCLRYLDEDPWERLRKIRAKMPNTKLQMLRRGQNLLGYKHYPDDIVRAFVRKSVENGIDIIRIFDALNDLRNIEVAVDEGLKCGAHVSGTLCYTTSPIHNLEMFVELGRQLEKMGCQSVCIKDMAGIMSPQAAFELVSALKKSLSVPVVVHTHCTTGTGPMTLLKAAEAGADVLDCAIASFSGGTSQPPTETMSYVLGEMGYETGLNTEALKEINDHFKNIRAKAIADGVLNPIVMGTDPDALTYQVPGGMLSNLISQLKQAGKEDKYYDVLAEIPRVRKDFGYPPLVTPTSQIVGTQAVMNVIVGKYKTFPKESKGLLRGEYGALPGEVNPEVRALAGIDPEEVITCRPADNIAPELETYKEQFKDIAKSEEDVLSLALFPQVAPKFLTWRDGPHEAPAQPAEAPKAPPADHNAVRTGRLKGEDAQLMIISAQTEADIAELEDFDERQMFLEDLGLEESGVARLIKSAYKLLNLETFFTTGADETRAWPYSRGMKAPQTAGIIHTDFERGFIRAEVIKYDDYVTLGSEKACRDVGKIGIEGKEYVVQDGDIMHFLFNV